MWSRDGDEGGGSTVNAKYRSDHRDVCVCVCVCDVWCVTVMHCTKVRDMYSSSPILFIIRLIVLYKDKKGVPVSEKSI
jgi:hypothetical protein